MDIRIWESATATFWATVFIALALILCFGRYAIGAECLSSDAEVRKVHGVTAWSTWRRIDGKKCWMEGTRHEDVHGRPGPRRGHSVASTANDHIKTYRRTSTRVLRRPNSLVEPMGANEVLVGDRDRRVIAAQTAAQSDEVPQWSEEPEFKRQLWLISFQSWAMRQWADGWDNVYEARERYNGRTVHTEAVESRALSYSEIQKVRIIY